ncbi:hypothetical protein [Shewanella sp. SR44-3]|uniref:hypothetical protein n=1 Tax=unclassified Shewanella TaxID=196818 RepID=UPI0015FD13AA|nr:hypothetical protein [Shewanella sp. SR44-3]MBB1268685.1 hypothetical protein [Shewanella sp. SR44-3]
MRTIKILTSLLFTLSFAASANENQTPQAPNEVLSSLRDACHQIAAEEKIEDMENASFVFDCINDQLNEMGYQRLLPSENPTPAL